MDDSKPSSFLTSLFVILAVVVLGVIIAAIGIGAYFLRECPVQPYIPVYLIVFGIFFFACSDLPSSTYLLSAGSSQGVSGYILYILPVMTQQVKRTTATKLFTSLHSG
ncbi:hypothetical protein QQF64_030702 [Cirrhinus molitorella]|uniref:NADH dehydrogenase subunit 6 n=1 Tax=Cirrhinus molitorella TaxID=172907 RepID=A0ABR3N4E1_9TELE